MLHVAQHFFRTMLGKHLLPQGRRRVAAALTYALSSQPPRTCWFCRVLSVRQNKWIPFCSPLISKELLCLSDHFPSLLRRRGPFLLLGYDLVKIINLCLISYFLVVPVLVLELCINLLCQTRPPVASSHVVSFVGWCFLEFASCPPSFPLSLSPLYSYHQLS